VNLNGKRVALPQLRAEMAAAGIVLPALGQIADELVTYSPDGDVIDVPPEGQPVLDAHTPPPLVINYAGAQAVNALARTTDDVALEVFRFPTEPKRVYRVTLRITGIDAGNGTTKDTEARAVFKRPAGTVNQVGATDVLSNFQDTAASTWAILPTVDGTDLVISVRGAAGRAIDWLLVGEIGMYAPEGAA
jgi:hypothetical protein